MWNGNDYPHPHPYYPQPPIHPGDPRYAAAMALQLQQQQQQGHYGYANGHAPPGYGARDETDDKMDDDDDDDDVDDDVQSSSQKGEEDDDNDDGSSSSSSSNNNNEDDDDDDDSDSGDDDNGDKKPAAKASIVSSGTADSSPSPPTPQTQQPRGKPEAMAAQLAFAVKEQQILEEQERQKAEAAAAALHGNGDDNVAPMDSLAKHSTKVKSTTPKNAATSSKKKAAGSSTPTPAKSKKSPVSKKKVAASTKRSPASIKGSAVLASIDLSNLPTMDDPVEPITKRQYEKLEEVMVNFCKVPLLAEFSRPVAVLHPELMSVYSKIVEHPIDLGKVCRRVRRRQYTNLRDVRLDTWRIFANCVKYHSHPNNKQAVPSFVSIALHLKDLFNDLWQEHMLPSDFPSLPLHGKMSTTKGSQRSNDPNADLRAAMDERSKDRKRRLVVSGLSIMNGSTLKSAADALEKFVENGGRVDQLDNPPIWGEGVKLEDDDESDAQMVISNLRKFAQELHQMSSKDDDLGVDELDTKIRKCYTDSEGFETMNPVLRMRIASRLGRFVGQLIVPINEANCRGVSQSSVWGCMAAGVWARESSKKPFWPALVLGILAPVDQSEEWHKALTERNEARLPEKLKTQLMSGKRKAEQAIKRQAAGLAEPQSFFLVEFLGSHEFIWVREADIVENFSADEDPNKGDIEPGTNKKKRISRSTLNNILGSKTYASAIEEAQWALEEFELQLQDIGLEPKETTGGNEEDRTEEGYSFSVLSQSDDEAEDEEDDSPSSESLDIDECNELLATNGLLDYSTAGRKKRAQILKQHKLDAEKKKKAQKVRKDRADKARKVNDAKQKEKEKKQEQRDLEKKRRKRTREREKALKGIEHQKKKLKLSDPAPGRRHMIISKRERAEAIVDGYIDRTAKIGQYKTLSLGGGEEKWIPSAVIDSNNLCGMALAFRAAAGMIPMPNPVTTGPGKHIVKPWDAIRLHGKKSDERCAILEKQIELVEKEIQIVNAQKEKRVALLKVAKQAADEMNDSITRNDEAARENPLKKAKKAHPLSGKKRSRSTDDDEESVDSMDAAEVGKESSDNPDRQKGKGDLVAAVTHDVPDTNEGIPSKSDVNEESTPEVTAVPEFA